MSTIYEVNVDVPATRSDEFFAFLVPHIADMKEALKGIQNVRIGRREKAAESPEGYVGYTVTYLVEKREDVDDYIENRSSILRKPLVDQFGTDLRAFRRIMEVAPFE